ncbi:MAG: hypothetical protein ACHQQQ_14040 [Bacteroidota bacterium]
MKFTKILVLFLMVFTFAFAGFAQDSTKTEAPKVTKKHHMMKKGEAKSEMGGTKGMKKMSKKGKKSAKKADADSTSAKPAEQQQQ